MTKENTQTTAGIEQVTNSAAGTEDISPARTESEFMEETIKDIKQTQKTIQEQNASEDTNTDSTTIEDGGVIVDGSTKPIGELAGTKIPEAFSQVAEELGMTPAEIVAIADTHTDEQLLEMVPFLQESSGTDMDEEPEGPNTESSDDNSIKDKEAIDVNQELIDKAIEKKIAELGLGLDDIKQFKEQQVAQQNQQMLETANRKFDEAAKEFPIFGDTKELPRFTTGRLKGQYIPTSPAYKARMEVVKYADAFMSIGNSVSDAMDLALNTYKGKNLRTEVERSLIKDLKRHEQNLSGVRTGKETKKKYADTREEIIEDIRSLQRQAGIDT